MPDAAAEIRALAADRRSGAAEIARRAAMALARSDDAASLALSLVGGHPSMAPVLRLASMVVGDAAGGARAFLDELEADASIAVRASEAAGDPLLTISWSSTVLEVVRARRPDLLVCMRSEPGGEGARMAEAAGAFTQACVVDDDEALATVPARTVLVGADAVTPAGLVNKVKTRAVAEAARTLDVPCYAVAGLTKFVSPGVSVVEPFEEVPLEVFTGIVTPNGVLDAEGARGLAVARPLHPDVIAAATERAAY